MLQWGAYTANEACADVSKDLHEIRWDAGDSLGATTKGGCQKAERVCRLVILGVHTCLPFEEGITHVWMPTH